ncbi:MAG: PQQ-binding-like beta-propeller repeat protein [Opitutales bacterium]|nr:PQQ-binding-like beta-propeller repeat protein [Opitutales bacterium]
MPNLTCAQNWNRWLGPNYDGSTESLVLEIPGKSKSFSTAWNIPVGDGWSSPLIEDGTVFFHDRIGSNEIIHCLDIKTGKERWSYSYHSGYRDDFGMANGPRSTPALSQGIIITHGPHGLVHALNSKDGSLLWFRDLKQDFSSPKGFFGRCSSPLVSKDHVVFNVGGPLSGLVSFSLVSGKINWKSKPYGNDYASPVLFSLDGQSFCLAFMREGFLVVELESGKEIFFDSFRSSINASVNAASPLVVGNEVFLTSCYGVGAGLWGGYSRYNRPVFFKKIWSEKGLLDCHYSTPVAHNGYLFGFHGRQERGPTLRCISLKKRSLKWEVSSLGCGNLIKVANRILTLTDRGELIVFSCDPTQFKILHRQQILGTGGRSHFAIAGGVLVARDQRRLICLDLKKIE